MKKIITFITVLLFGTLIFSADLIKIGFVDVTKVFDQYEKTKNATDKLNEKIKNKQEDIKKREGEIRKLKKQFEEQSMIWREEKKVQQQSIMENRLKELREYAVQVKKELTEEEQKLTTDILADIEETIKTIGEEGGYTYILRGANVLYALPENDLTEQVLEKLNKTQVDNE